VPEVPDGELVGNACSALVAMGEAAAFEEAIERMVRIERVYEPDQRAYAVHSERYDAYRAMRTKMEKFLE
jgi:sugar (pentulose or hexulose) kinase